MFTGLVQATGVVEDFASSGSGASLVLSARLGELDRGESVAVNGVCLTMIPDDRLLRADVSPETLARTTIGSLKPGMVVNLERALTLQDRLGGHLVQGHVDTTGRLESIVREDEFSLFTWSIGGDYSDLLVDKGSVAVDGISLTVVDPTDRQFSAAIIPETMSRTNLSSASVGDAVNIELDMIGKYVRRMLRPHMKT